MKLSHKPDGTPYARLYLGKDADGKAIRPYREFLGMTDEEAGQAAELWRREQEGRYSAKGLTTAQALHEYVNSLEALGRGRNTIRMYRHYADSYLLSLSTKPVEAVTTQDFDNNFQDLLKTGTSSGKPLSARTIQTYRAFLLGAWKVFVRHGMAPANVIRDTMRPQATGHEAQALDDLDAQRLLEAVRDDLRAFPSRDRQKEILQRCRALAVLLALFTGMRVGEVAALRMRDVNLTRRIVTISGSVVVSGGEAIRQDTTKGKRTRNVCIDEETTAELVKHADWLRKTIKPFTRNTPICTTDGEYMQPPNLSRGFTIYRKRLGLDRNLTFHSLRHTHATVLLQQGINPRVIQERLGHADVRTTLAIYGHVMSTNDYEAALTFANGINQLLKLRTVPMSANGKNGGIARNVQRSW